MKIEVVPTKPQTITLADVWRLHGNTPGNPIVTLSKINNPSWKNLYRVLPVWGGSKNGITSFVPLQSNKRATIEGSDTVPLTWVEPRMRQQQPNDRFQILSYNGSYNSNP